MGQNGSSVATVTGAGSKLTASNRLQVGRVGTPSVTLTVADGGLVQTALLQFGEGGESTVGNVHMAGGGILAVLGNKTANPFVNGGLFTFSGTPTSEIQYDAGAGFVNMNGAAILDTDYTLTYAAHRRTDGQRPRPLRLHCPDDHPRAIFDESSGPWRTGSAAPPPRISDRPACRQAGFRPTDRQFKPPRMCSGAVFLSLRSKPQSNSL